MIKSVLSKIKSNIWMFVCLIIGSLLITSVLSCIPMYTMGTLRQMLAADMRVYEHDEKKPAGQMYFTGKIPELAFGTQKAARAEEMKSKVIDGLDGTAVSTKNYYTQVFCATLKPEKGIKTFEYSTQWMITTLSGLTDNVTLVEGRMYEDDTSDGVLEVLVEESEFYENPKIELEGEYTLNKDGTVITVRPVGIFTVNDPDSVFWYNEETLFSETLFASEKGFENYFYNERSMAEMITGVNVYANLDFSKAGIDNLSTFIVYYQNLYAYMKDLGLGRGNLTLNSVKLINTYLTKTTKMQMSLWVLNVPVIAMLAFYMIMVTKMIIEEDKNEISTFKSRGAKTSQIFVRYVIESLFICAIALVCGPLLGFVLAKTVGNASGFLEFNARELMPIKLSPEAYLYALVACLFFSALILLPALNATKGTIVNLKQHRARKSHLAWWEKFFVDFICLIVSVGLFFVYRRTNGFNVDGTVDPVVYVISSLFILGCGLFFLRVYPFLVALVFKATKRILPPSAFSAFVQVSRGGNDYRFLMLFLVMTISVGIYSSASARIINNNVEHTVNFTNGADAVIRPDFTDYEPYQYNEDGTVTAIPETFRHFPVEDYEKNVYVDALSRVSYADNVFCMDVERGYWHDGFRIMAVDPYEFGQISWLGTNLNGRHWNEYLNVLELSPTAVLISSTTAERVGAEVGDVINLEINASNVYENENWPQVQCFVAGIIDYWPTMNYGGLKELHEEDEFGRSYYDYGESFIIMNFEYLYSNRDTAPFDLFVKLKDNAKKGIDMFTQQAMGSDLITDPEQILVYRPDIMENAKSDSMLKGLNGSYSIGFVSTLTVAFVGFLIYWIMNVRKRKLQFGILRAMGLTKGKLTLMLFIEHMLTTGVSVLMGILIGALTVKVYTPLLTVAYSQSKLPLDIIFNRSDNAKIYIVVALMLVTGIAVLAAFINKLKINEAVKIGEE